MNITRNINPTQAYISESVTLDNGMIVQRYSICLTSLVDYHVWEPSSLMGAHSTLTSINGKWYGSLPTRPLPPEIEALPGYKPGFWPKERIAASTSFHECLERQAEAIVKATFPKDFI